MDRRKDGKMGEACTNVKDTPYAMEICIKCVYIYIYGRKYILERIGIVLAWRNCLIERGEIFTVAFVSFIPHFIFHRNTFNS